jgi:hypothetical protein
MASRRCPGVGGISCPYYLASWDLHDTCKSHRDCAIETRCSICADWGDKEWTHIPLLVKKVTSKRKKNTRSSCKSLSSPQSPTLTSADLQQSVDAFKGPLSLESGVGETNASADAFDLMGCLPGFSGAAKHPSLTSPPGESVRRNPDVSLSGGGVTPSSISNIHSESSRESRRRVSATQTSGLILNETQSVLASEPRSQSFTRPAGQVSARESARSGAADFATSGSESRRDSEYDPGTRVTDLREARTSTRVDYDFPSATRGEPDPTGQAQWGTHPVGTTSQHRARRTGDASAFPGNSPGQGDYPWAMYPPFSWGGYAPPMGWFPRGMGKPVPPPPGISPTQRPGLQAAAAHSAGGWPWGPPPPGYHFPRLTVDPYPRAQGREIQRGITSQSYPLESVTRSPLPESPTPLSLALQTAEPSGCESSPTGMDYTSGDEGLPSREYQKVATSGTPWAEDEEPGSESEAQSRETIHSCATYEEALTQVKPFLGSLVDPQGFPITMEEPVASTRRRMTSLLTGPTGPTQQGGLPWTLDMGTSIYKLNLALRGVPRSQQRRYVTEGLPLPLADNAAMGRGSFPGSFGRSADTALFRSYPYQLPGLGECVSLPTHIPEIPQRLGAAHPKPPSQVNLTWKAACEGEQLTRQQASLLSHASWWNYALQRRLQSLSDNVYDMDPAEVAKATSEAASWAQAGLTVVTKALEANQTLMAQYLLLRRDAVLDQTRLPRGRSSLLRAAPLESPDLFGPRFDEMASTWTMEDEQAKTLGGNKPTTFRRPAPQGEKKAAAKPTGQTARYTGKAAKASRWLPRGQRPRGTNKSGPKPLPKGGSNQPPRRK